MDLTKLHKSLTIVVMEQIILTKQVRYFAGDQEVWSVVSIAEHYGLSKNTVLLSWTKLSSFPKPYAESANGGKRYYLASEVQQWAETEPYAQESLRRSALGIGRPKQNPLGAKDTLRVVVKM
jgi:hypothetical protein